MNLKKYITNKWAACGVNESFKNVAVVDRKPSQGWWTNIATGEMDGKQFEVYENDDFEYRHPAGDVVAVFS